MSTDTDHDGRPVFRFAPSPNGPLHLGHALSAGVGFTMARERDGRFLVRIEDIDTGRTRPEHVEAIFRDLAWLGLSWEEPVLHQSSRFAAYEDAARSLSEAGLLNSYAGLVMPSIISVFGIFWIRQFFRTIPDDLLHAARLDGMGEFEIVWRIMLPAAMPALTAFGILSVVIHWNDYFWPLLIVTSPDMAMPALGTVYLRNTEAGIDYGPLMAGAVIITAPLVLFFLAAQRRFIEGMTLSGIK